MGRTMAEQTQRAAAHRTEYMKNLAVAEAEEASKKA
jgi:hypothetical protein